MRIDIKYTIEFTELKAIEISRGHYFNSLSHFYESLHIETGYSINKLKNTFSERIFFKDNQVVFKEKPEYEEPKGLPNYILNTRRIKNGTYWLKDREYQILLYLNRLACYVQGLNEENDKNSPIYVSIKGISKEIGCSFWEARYSLVKLSLYFENFRVWEDNFEERFHPESCSFTTHLPSRKEWKKIIEAKIVEMTGLDSLKIEKPYYVNKGDMKLLRQLWEKGVKRSIAAHAKLKGFIEEQNQRLIKGAEIWREIKEDFQETWEIARGKFSLFLAELNELKIISDLEEHRIFKSVNPYDDPGGLEQRILDCINILKEKYPSLPNNLSVSW